MKKMISLTLVIALFATLTVCASADVVPHDDWFCDPQSYMLEDDVMEWLLLVDPDCNWVGIIAEGAKWETQGCADAVMLVEKPEDMTQSWTSHKQAITAEEMQAICDANEDINNLTVFRQRNVNTEGGEMTLTLWGCNPAKIANQAVVVLYRAAESEEWSVLGINSDDKTVTVSLPAGEGAYVVCLAW